MTNGVKVLMCADIIILGLSAQNCLFEDHDNSKFQHYMTSTSVYLSSV